MSTPEFGKETDSPDLEIVEVTALEAINRAEIDVQIATAHRFPRSLAKFQKKALEMATLDEETAASCLYQLTRKDKNSPTGVKVIEGESIRLAEIVAASYGNMRIAAQITSQTPHKVTVRAVAHDLESNVLFAQEKVAPTVYKDGNPYSSDMAIIVANATISKALRDAIFRVVPKALIKSTKEAVKLVAIGTSATLAARRSKAMEWAKSLKIDMARIYAVLGVGGEADIGLGQLEVLTGLRTAIRENDQSVDEAFPVIEKQPAPGPSFGKAEDKAEAAAGLAPAPAPAPAQPAEMPAPRGRPRGRPPQQDPVQPPINYPKAARDLLKMAKVDEADMLNWFIQTQALDDSVKSIDEMEIVAPARLHAFVDHWAEHSGNMLDWLGPTN